MAGREERFGTTSTYMAHSYNDLVVNNNTLYHMGNTFVEPGPLRSLVRHVDNIIRQGPEPRKTQADERGHAWW